MGGINKHVSDGVNKLLFEDKCDLTCQKTLPTDEAKDSSKFEAKLVDVMGTIQKRFQSLRRVKRGDHKCPRSLAQAEGG